MPVDCMVYRHMRKCFLMSILPFYLGLPVLSVTDSWKNFTIALSEFYLLDARPVVQRIVPEARCSLN